MSVDSVLLEKFAKLKVVPNIMILPSDLKCYVRVSFFVAFLSFFSISLKNNFFSQDIHNCLTINPGRVVFDTQGSGTFARLIINPVKEDDEKLFNFVGCQVVKI